MTRTGPDAARGDSRIKGLWSGELQHLNQGNINA